jgi:hypothetical protein
MKKNNRLFSIFLWFLVAFAGYLFINAFAAGFLGMIEMLTLGSRRYIVFLTLCLLAGLAWLYGLIAILIRKDPLRISKRLAKFLEILPGWLRWILAIAVSLFPTYILLFNSFGLMEFAYAFRIGLIIISGLVAAALAFPPHRTGSWLFIAAAWICTSGAFFATGGWLNRVTNYPFGLYWSEGNRLWDYSMLFGSNRYSTSSNEPVFTFITKGRQFIWAIPFLIPNIGILGVRLWDALMWIVPTFLVGFLAITGVRKGKEGWLIGLLFGLWTFSFLSQGPIYAPLVVSTILVILAVRSRSLALSILLVLAASWYADFSRYTWRYAPGLWAGMLALFEIAQPAFSNGRWKQFIRPVVLGLSGFIGGQFLQSLITWVQNGFSSELQVNALANVSGALSRQPLLWDRLWPNPTFPPGILLGALWAGLGLSLLLILLRVSRNWKLHWLHSLAATGVSVLFLVIGIIISTKIGGGSNLHNLDMFWISLALLAAWALRALLKAGFTIEGKPWWLIGAFCLALISPASYLAQYGKPLELPDKTLVEESLTLIQNRVDAVQEGREILFIDQRQLLTFGDIQNVELVADYEKKYLMDQAMSDNAAYFEKFIDDLAHHRFALIVTEPVRINYVTESERNFGEENNAWVKWVSSPLLCYYREAEYLPWVGVQLLVPRTFQEMPESCDLP